MDLKLPFVLAAPNWSIEPGGTFSAVWGTGYESGRALIEIEHRGKILKRYWTDAKRTQVKIEQAVTESMRGGFYLHVTMVKENRLYAKTQFINVPWSNKQLVLKWEHFVSKLLPGQKETWTLVVSGPPGKDKEHQRLKAAAELVSTLYDASLDAFVSHQWSALQHVFRRDQSTRQTRFLNRIIQLQQVRGRWAWQNFATGIKYRGFHTDLVMPMANRRFASGSRMREFGGGMSADAEAAPMEMMDKSVADPRDANGRTSTVAIRGENLSNGNTTASSPVNLDKVAARKNLQETAFFFPTMKTDKDGTVRLEFTMPEALTEWKFMALAHDREL